MSTFYTGVDKQRYDEGNKFVPMNQFLLDYKTPTTNTEEEVTTSYGIPNTNAFVNSGGGGGVVNYRTDYRPNYGYRRGVDYDPNLSATANQKQFDMYQDYYNEPAPSGIAQLINKGMNFIPGFGMVKRGAEFLGDTLGKYMPVNQRAIMENELRGAGVYTDDIGRIVAGKSGYNTPEGIMAGYNANAMTEKTFDKRTDTIANTLSNKYGVDISNMTDEEIEGFDINNPAYNLVNRYSLINQAKKNYFNTKKKADDIYEWEKKQKEIKEYKDAGGPDTVDWDPKGPSQATIRDERPDKSGSGHIGGFTDPGKDSYGPHKADGGRVYLNLGGLASMLGREDFKKGGRIGFFQGALADTKEGKAMSPGTTASGDFRGDGGQGDGGNTVVVPKTNYIDVKPDLLTTEPAVELNYTPSELANIRARLYNEDLTKQDDIDLEGELSGSLPGNVDYSTLFTDQGIGDTNVNWNDIAATIDANKNIKNISFDKDIGNFNFQGNTDLENYGLGISYQPNDWLSAGATTDSMGNTNFNVGAKWEFGKPDQPVKRTLSLKEQNPDLILSNMKYGGLARLL